MAEEKKNNISRRGFLKAMGAGATVAAGAALESCGSKKKDLQYDPAGHHTTEVPIGQMTYRTWPTGDKVSILGYGCMRWPTLQTVSYTHLTLPTICSV